MKTPEAIKKGLACCAEASPGACDHCPYVNDCEDFGACKLPRDALAYINQIESRVPKWISVKDRLPEDDGEVLILVNGRRVYLGYYKNRECLNNILVEGEIVTHWMPIPETPKEE